MDDIQDQIKILGIAIVALTSVAIFFYHRLCTKFFYVLQMVRAILNFLDNIYNPKNSKKPKVKKDE